MLALSLVAIVAVTPGIDAERASWRYRQNVVVAGDAPLAALTLPPELSTKAGPFGRDFRLVDEAGRETPYLLDWTSEREGLATWRASVKDIRREREDGAASSTVRTQWTIDLGEERSFTDLDLDVPRAAFAWHVRVESSSDGARYALADADASLFDQVWNGEHVRKTNIRFDGPLAARYLRLTARSAANRPTLELQGASVTLRRRLKGDAWSVNAVATPIEGEAAESKKGTRYRLDASSLLPFDEVEVVCDDPAFFRRVRLVEEQSGAGRKADTVLGEGSVFRIRTNDVVAAADAARFGTRNGIGGALILEVDNGGSPPLRTLRVRLHGSRVRLLFPVSSRALTLYYGNETTRAPAYDLEGLRPRLTQAMDMGSAALGGEEMNPAFKREPPLRFAATLGASLDASQWRHERRIAPLREEDVYALTLRAQDLAALRADLADLRVVTSQNEQVPFLIDPEFTEERVSFKVEKAASPPPRRSLYVLTPDGTWAAEGAPRLSRIEIDVADAFFERPARLLHSGNQSRREVPFSLSLARRPPATGSMVIGTTAPVGSLNLEVDDGDNAALDVKSAAGFVRVPRVVFKAAPGDLRLLLGNQGADPPRYDIAGLRSELLAYSSVATNAGALNANKGARDTLFSRFGGAPRGAFVWGAIIVAIIALVALTLRTLKSA